MLESKQNAQINQVELVVMFLMFKFDLACAKDTFLKSQDSPIRKPQKSSEEVKIFYVRSAILLYINVYRSIVPHICCMGPQHRSYWSLYVNLQLSCFV